MDNTAYVYKLKEEIVREEYALLRDKLDELDEDDYFGTQGWKYILEFDDDGITVDLAGKSRFILTENDAREHAKHIVALLNIPNENRKDNLQLLTKLLRDGVITLNEE